MKSYCCSLERKYLTMWKIFKGAGGDMYHARNKNKGILVIIPSVNANFSFSISKEADILPFITFSG